MEISFIERASVNRHEPLVRPSNEIQVQTQVEVSDCKSEAVIAVIFSLD